MPLSPDEREKLIKSLTGQSQAMKRRARGDSVEHADENGDLPGRPKERQEEDGPAVRS